MFKITLTRPADPIAQAIYEGKIAGSSEVVPNIIEEVYEGDTDFILGLAFGELSGDKDRGYARKINTVLIEPIVVTLNFTEDQDDLIRAQLEHLAENQLANQMSDDVFDEDKETFDDFLRRVGVYRTEYEYAVYVPISYGGYSENQVVYLHDLISFTQGYLILNEDVDISVFANNNGVFERVDDY